MSNGTPQLEPTIFVVFGVTGDLSRRYLLPALYHLFEEELLPEATEIVGLTRQDLSTEAIFSDSQLGNDGDNNPDTLAGMKAKTSVLQFDPTVSEDYQKLRKYLDDLEDKHGLCMNRLFYLSIPPNLFEQSVENLGSAGLNGSCKHGAAKSRLLVEKPFGDDLASAQQLVTSTNAVFAEEQVFRIDHYLAKETVQNILTFRAYNPIFEGIWNNQFIEAIDIIAYEKIGIEGRKAFYEGVGALRDLIQSHLLQLLAVTTMPLPTEQTSDSIHSHKHALFEMILPANPATAVRGQYDSYHNEIGESDSTTETFASIQVRIDSNQWRDVPITITTGKALSEKRTEVQVTFTNRADVSQAVNQLIFRIQPNEGIHLQLRVKKPGYEHDLQDAAMDFSYQSTFGNEGHPNAYERVLVDAVRGDHTLFATSDEVIASWRIIEPIIHAWSHNANGLQIYTSGSPGPTG